ncbi:MAG TPA: hypothetical protein VIU46_04945 [Gallionellaceae bacterium]
MLSGEINIDTLIYFTLAMLPGLALALVEWIDWKRRPTTLGAPPPGHHQGTLFCFALFSFAYLALSWRFSGIVSGIFACIVFLVFMDAMTLNLLGHMNIFRRKGITWSRRQQIRDGFVMASFLVLPIVLFIEAGHK